MKQYDEKNFDNCIWICCRKFSILQTEYLSVTVNVLTKNRKFSIITKRDIFQLKFSQNHEQCNENVILQISAVFGTL